MNCRYCIIVPVFNHCAALQETFSDIAETGLPCISINDGSTDGSLDQLRQLEQQYKWLEVISRDENGGKGAAVMMGFKHALEQGFTHAITVDADGQHDLGAIAPSLELSRANPDAAIIGRPIFDENAPIERLIGREISNFFTWLAMLSISARDGLCGYRVYPLHRCAEYLFKKSKAKRMEFDPEVLVLMAWDGTPLINIPIEVSYPSDGVSHFNYFRDNVMIIARFTRLVLGMVPRSPLLIGRRILRSFRSNDSSPSSKGVKPKSLQA